MDREREEKLKKLDRMLTENPDKEEITSTREEAIDLSVEILKRFKKEIGLA